MTGYAYFSVLGQALKTRYLKMIQSVDFSLHFKYEAQGDVSASEGHHH